MQLRNVLPRMGCSARRGFSLVEIAMTLAVISLVVAATMLMFSNAEENRRVSDTLAEVAIIASSVRQQYGSQPDYSDLTSQDVINGGELPGKLVDKVANVIRNPFGGTVGVNRSGYSPGMFAMAFTDIPTDACVRLVLIDMGPSMFLVNVDFGDGAFNKAMSIGDAYERCRINTPGRHVVSWTFQS